MLGQDGAGCRQAGDTGDEGTGGDFEKAQVGAEVRLVRCCGVGQNAGGGYGFHGKSMGATIGTSAVVGVVTQGFNLDAVFHAVAEEGSRYLVMGNVLCYRKFRNSTKACEGSI